MVAHKCYIAMLEIDDHLQTVYRRTMDSSRTGELEKVLLDDSMPRRIMRIGTLASSLVCQALIMFLRENQDVFAWSHEDISRIDLLIIVHKLNVSPLFSFVW